MSLGPSPDMDSLWSTVDAVRRAWPLSTSNGGPDRWWLSGSAALAVHFGDFWRPVRDLDVTLDRIVLARAVDKVDKASAVWGPSLSEWFRADLPSQPGPFIVDEAFGLPVSYRCVRRVPGYWWSESYPELVVESSEAVLLSGNGIPYLAPELVLLGKLRQSRPKDRADFSHVVERLEPARREWVMSVLREKASGV